MGEQIGSADRSSSMERGLMRKRGNLLRIKHGTAHQGIRAANKPSAQDHLCGPPDNIFSSENTLLDGCNINGGGGPFCRREKNSYLVHDTNFHLSHDEDGRDEYDECVKEVEVDLHVAKSGYTCSVCSRDFKSIKSLSGHMRCHPERDWRGIQPPSAVRNGASSTVSESGGQKMDDQNDSATTMESLASGHLPPLSNWPAKRNRNITPVRRVKVELEDLSEEELEAIENLLMLANGEMEDLQGRKKRVGEESVAKSMDFEPEISQTQEHDYPSGNGYRLNIVKDNRTGIIGRTEQMNSNRNKEQLPCSNETGKRISKKRKFQLMKSVYRKQKVLRHICRTCNRSFSSHQALGGHRASHQKKVSLMCVPEADELLEGDDIEDNRCASSDVAGTKLLAETDVSSSKAEMVHQCRTCNKTFMSGQALGGHQRCHWGGLVEAPTIPYGLQEDEKKSSHRLRDIDLNELPMDGDWNDLGF